MGPTLIPLHPEAVPGRPDQLRWRVPEGLFGDRGDVVAAPGLLGGSSPLRAVSVEPGAVSTTLATGRSWSADGPAVRTALHAALAVAEHWVVMPDRDPDGVLAEQVAAALEGPAGAVVRSHGGTVEVMSVADAIVTLRLGGSCDGCPAMGFTIGTRLTEDLRRACPAVREVLVAD